MKPKSSKPRQKTTKISAKPTSSTSDKISKPKRSKRSEKASLQKQGSKKLDKLDDWLCKLYETEGNKKKSDKDVSCPKNAASTATDNVTKQYNNTITSDNKPKPIKEKKKSKNLDNQTSNLKLKSTNKKPVKRNTTNQLLQSLPYKNRTSEYIKLESKEYKCSKCEYVHNNLISIRSHFDKEHNSEVYKCILCPFETKQQYYFNSHVKQHSKPDAQCPHCKKMIKWFSFKMHVKTHERNDKTEYKCEICDYRSYNHANVKRHTLTQHKNPHELKSFKCESCDYVTVLPERLKQHKRVVHSKEGNWITCEHCEYTTRNKSHMTRHVNDIHKAKSIKCPECGQLFSSKEHLRYHMQRKHEDQNERPFYYCEMCPKEDRYKTTEKGNLARHILAHRTLDEIEVFACHKCPYLGKCRNALKTHLINAHLPEMHNFKCKTCGYSTNTKSRYSTHMKIVHGQPIVKTSSNIQQNNNTDGNVEMETNNAAMDCQLNDTLNDITIKEEVDDF